MAAQSSGTEHSQRRMVRVFVSSTFRDLHAEREELVKRVFPQLRAVCEQRGVAWSEVDLRWGITDEQKAEGRVLPICLAEIDNCRPYFIGVLGERYGWVPEAIPPEVIEGEPWLAGLEDRSLTELEILHGALNDPDAADRAFFYFRDPSYLDTVPDGDRAVFGGGPSDADVERFGPQEAARRAADDAVKLTRLKDRIRASGLPLVDGYRTPRELGECVVRDLTAALERRFPSAEETRPFERESDAQAALEAGLRRVYVPRQDYFDRLDEQASGTPLLVFGPPGSGKSALLANWVARLDADAAPGPVVVRHFVGASPESRNWSVLVERVLHELKDRLGIAQAVPHDPQVLRNALAEWLHLSVAAARTGIVLVIDGVDQLDDRDGALNLPWLPGEIPPQVQLVVSAASGRPLTVLQERGWSTLQIEPLEFGERTRLIHDYLGQVGKSLLPAHVRRIAAADPSANPLYLRTLLEELRVYGDHPTLDGRIEHYLSASTAEDLYALVLERYEQDYEDDHPGLVGEAFSLLWAARRGLAEAELLDLLGSDGTPLPSHVWSPLFLAARPALRTTTELLGFAHGSLRDAVRRRYLDSADVQRATHRRLAEYFAFRPDPEPLRAELAQLASRTAGHPVDPAVTDRVMAIRLHPRRMEEHPWQLVRAQEWQQLQELLGDPVFLDIAYGATVSAPDARKTDLLEYWTQVEAGSAFRLVDAYRPMIDAPDVQSTGALVAAAILLHDTEHSAEALVLTEHLAHRSAATGDLVGYADALIEQALNRDDLGDPGGAIAQCREAEAILRRLDTAGARQLLMTCLINLGNMLRRQADPDIATAILREAEELAGELGDRGVLASSLYNQALLLEARGDRRGAIELLDRDEAICRERGDLRGIASSIATRARLTEPDGPDRALAWLQEAEDIARRLGLRGRQLEYLYGQARILRRQGRTAEALDAFRAGERLAREAPDRHDLRQMLVHFLGNISLLLVQRGEYDAARQILDEQEAICREIDDRYALQATLGDRVFLHVELGELEEALELVAQQERICREIDHPRALLLTLVLQAQLFRRSADLDRAAHSYAEAADLARALDDRERLDACLASLVDIQSERTAPSDVRPLLEERAQVLRSLDRPDDLQHVLVQLAVHHRTMGEPEYAESALEELEQLIQQRGDADAMDRLAELRAMLGDVIESAGSICLRANAHMNDGRLDRALEVFEQAMTRYPSYVWGWSDMGICLLGMDRYAEAERALTRATELGADDVGTWAPLGATRLLQGNLDGALDCLRVCVEIDIHDPGTRRLAAMMHDHLQEAVAATGEDDPAVHDLLGDLRQIVEADQSRHPGPGPPSGRARRSRREGR